MKRSIMSILLILIMLLPIKVDAARLESMVSDETCQISINVDVPEHFDIPCYAIFYNADTDTEYQVNLIKENDYRGRISVTPGTYLVAQVSAMEDITCKYPFNFPIDPFILTDSNTTTIEARLKNYEEVQTTIEEFIEASEESIIEETPTEEPIEEVIPEEEIVEEEESTLPLILVIIIVVIIIIFIAFIIHSLYKEN